MRNSAPHSPLLQHLLADYQAKRPQGTHQYDDLVTREGQFRARWQPLVEELDELGLDGLQQRTLEAQNLLYENGVTFNVYEDEVRKLRSWQLDPIPYVISPQSWTMLEQGLKQRARLLESLVADLYGERRVLNDGILPPELI
ncbi:MAG: circularly permuted type 2 ATP-grasp protein [Oceanisphaera sp.]|nr:circularly permuted type 2 ATP-grasp protein [Oceanisphaera sp.]